jgi:hypothetical protein
VERIALLLAYFKEQIKIYFCGAKTGRSNSRQVWQNLVRKAMAQKRAVLPVLLLISNL